MYFGLAKAGGTVVAETAVILAEVAKREAIQMPAVGWVAKGTEVRVVRGGDEESPSGLQDAMKLLHRADHVRDVLDDVNRADFAEGAVAEGIRKAIEIAEYIGAGVRVPIHADGAGAFIYAASDV